MERLIGNQIVVCLKCDDSTVSGLLIDIEDEHVFVQTDQVVGATDMNYSMS